MLTRIATVARIVWLEMLRRKDLYVLLILLGALLFALLSLNVFGLGSTTRYVMDVGLLFTWLFSIVLTVSMAGRQLPQEEAKRTIYPLLAKPITRAELLLGKWLGVWTAAVAATILFYLLVVAIVAARGGAFDKACMAQALILHLAALACITALGLALSTRMSYGAAASMAYVVVAACFTIVPAVPELLTQQEGFGIYVLLLLFYGMPHFELFDVRQRLVHEWGAASWPVVGQIVLYGLLWAAVLLLAAHLGYRKKQFKRGATG